MYIIQLNRFLDTQDEVLREERELLIEKLGENILYNKNEKCAILLNKGKKLNSNYLRNMLYKVNLSFEKRNLNQKMFTKDNCLSEQGKRHLKIMINEQSIENVNIYDRIESIKTRKRNDYVGELFIDKQQMLYICLEDSLMFYWTTYKDIKNKDFDKRFVIEKDKAKEELYPYIGKWLKEDDLIIEKILNQYQEQKEVKYYYDLVDEYREELKEIDRDLERTFEMCFQEFESKYFITRRDSSIITVDSKTVNKELKLSDIELIIKAEIKILLEQYGYHKEILNKIYSEDQSITEFVESVILSMLHLDKEQRNVLMLSYNGIFKKQINQNIRDMINYYKRRNGIRDENLIKFIK